MPCLIYAADLVLCGESEGRSEGDGEKFVEVCRRDLIVNADKSKVMVLGGEKERKI